MHRLTRRLLDTGQHLHGVENLYHRGLGFVASAALVGEAFGLEGPVQAVDLGYVGSRVTGNGYIAWLHWPAA